MIKLKHSKEENEIPIYIYRKIISDIKSSLLFKFPEKSELINKVLKEYETKEENSVMKGYSESNIYKYFFNPAKQIERNI